MLRSAGRRRNAVATSVLLVLLAGCGVDANDSFSPAGNDKGPTVSDKPAPTTTQPSEDPSVPDVTGGISLPPLDDEQARDAMVSAFEGFGLSREKAECLADAFVDADLTDPGAFQSSAASDILSGCDVSITDFTGGGD